MRSEIDVRLVIRFLALTFGLSWTVALVLFVTGVGLGSPASLIAILIGYMWAPGIAAIIVARTAGLPVRRTLGVSLGRIRWMVVAWFAPLIFVVVTIVIALQLPGTTYTADLAGYLDQLGLPAADVEASMAQLEALTIPPVALFVIQGLVAGVTINALAALGEELGWRGFLLTHLAPWGFWKVSMVTGAIWGVWHAPIVLQGHNFPDSPVAGSMVMTLATITIAPVYTYLTLRARTVLAATVFHGTFNAVGAFTIVYVTGAGFLITSPVGLAGAGAGVVGTLACVIHDRGSKARLITPGPLRPWQARQATSEPPEDRSTSPPDED